MIQHKLSQRIWETRYFAYYHPAHLFKHAMQGLCLGKFNKTHMCELVSSQFSR